LLMRGNLHGKRTGRAINDTISSQLTGTAPDRYALSTGCIVAAVLAGVKEEILAKVPVSRCPGV